MSLNARFRSSFLVLLLALLASFAVFAQDSLQLGDMSYSRAPAPHLRQPVTRSAAFFRGVGGIAFHAVAQGEGGLSVTRLAYDAAAPDGQRLIVHVASP